jgi:cation:H+ antiporter
MVYVFLVAGLALLILGSETVLRGSIGLSTSFGVSPLFIGLFVVAAGTSAPEFFVSVQAALRNAPDLVLGSVVGSNIVNILLVLGLGASIRAIPSPPKVVFRDGSVLIAASVALLLIAQSGSVSRLTGCFLVVGFLAYLALSFATDRRRPAPLSFLQSRAVSRSGEPRSGLSAVLLVFGFVCLYIGSRFAVASGTAIAAAYHVPQMLIGLTVIAFGNALPELATTLSASRRGQSSIAAGLLIGSNIYNILLVLGLTAIIRPLPVSPSIAHADVYVMAGAALLLWPMMISGWRITRWQGVVLVVCYAGYLTFLAWRQGVFSA